MVDSVQGNLAVNDGSVPSAFLGGGAVAKHTPGPWVLGEYDQHLGYDCMTGGVRVGPVVLDAADYGQGWRSGSPPLSEEGMARMMADARLIAAAPKLLAACITLQMEAAAQGCGLLIADEAITEATGRPPPDHAPVRRRQQVT